MKISKRQLYRIIKRIRQNGSKEIIHKLSGKSSNRGYAQELKSKTVSIYRKEYPDYVPTLFSEMSLKY